MGRHIDPETKQYVKKLLEEGRSQASISRLTGVAITTVYRFRHEAENEDATGTFDLSDLPGYEAKINALIPEAEALARKRLALQDKKSEGRPGIDGLAYNHSFSTQFFHQEMNRLANDAGLRPL